MKPQALLILLLVAVMAIGGYFALQHGGQVAPAGLPDASAAQSSVDAGMASAKPESVTGMASQSASQAPVAVDRTAAPDTAPVDASAEGALLRGRLVDLAGAPRAGVEVSVHVWPGSDGRIDIRTDAVGSDRLKQVTSLADGSFQVRVPARCRGTLTLTHSDLVFAKEHHYEMTSGEQDLGDLLVVRSARLAGIVQDGKGKPVAGVALAAELGALGFGGQNKVDTDEEGKFSITKLAPGTWTLTTKSSQFLPTAQKIELAAEQQVTDLIIVVEPGMTISGRVIDERGVGVAGMKVASQRSKSVGGVDIQRFTTDEAAVTDATGNFTLAGLEGSSAMIRATGPGHTKVTLPNVKTGTSNVELRVQRLAEIHGVLVAADGSAIADSTISVSYPTARDGAMGAIEGMVDFDIPYGGPDVKTDADGKFVVQSVNPGVAVIKARGKTHLPVEQGGIQVAAAQIVRGIRLVADAGAIARIKVVDDDGAAIVGAAVRISNAKMAQRSGFSMTVRAEATDSGSIQFPGMALGTGETGDDGVATIMGLPAGDVVVAVTHDRYAPIDDAALALPASGAVDRQIVMLPPGFIEVVVKSQDGSVAAGTDVLLERPASADSGTGLAGLDNQDLVDKKTADAQGRVRFGPLAAGDYVVALSRGKKARSMGSVMMFVGDENDKIASSAKPLVLVGGQTASFEMVLPLLARVTGRVLGSDGPVVGCMVELAAAKDGSSGLGGSQERTGDDGTFTFEGVESGDYEVRYGKPDQVVKARLELTVPTNTAEVQKDLVLRTGKVRLLVLSADDAEPVARAEVKLERVGEATSGGKVQRRQQVMMVGISSIGNGDNEEISTMTFGAESVHTDEDGVAVFEDVPVGEYTLKIESKKFAPAEKKPVAVVELQLTDCGTIELAGAGQVRGTVKDAAGKPAMAMVEYRLVGVEEWSRGEMAMRGSYRLTGLAAGQYEVRARPVGPTAGEASESQQVEVLAGKTQVLDFTLTK